MKRQETISAQSHRSQHCRNTVKYDNVKIKLRPQSAKEIFEYNNRKRNEEAMKMEEMQSIVSEMKKREWQAKVYTSLSEYKPSLIEEDWKAIESRERLLNERRQKLKKLFAKDEAQYEMEREIKRATSTKANGLPPNLTHPEIELLKVRLEDLKRQNEEERRKIVDQLSYESWRRNNPSVRQMESDRFNKTVREAWAEQIVSKEEEKRKREEEIMKNELQNEERRKREEEQARLREENSYKQRMKWREELDNQLVELRFREEEETKLREREKDFEYEKLRLQNLISKRNQLKDQRKRRDLEIFWARQYQLKLKKKAADVLNELQEDQLIVEDMIARKRAEGAGGDSEKVFGEEESKWMLNVLEEQKKLELLREKEYDHLFSEEAKRMWAKREAEWRREQEARDKLFEEVMKGLKEQVTERMSSNEIKLGHLRRDREMLLSNIADKQNAIQELEKDEGDGGPSPEEFIKVPPCLPRETRQQEAWREKQIRDHQKEIEKLELEMKKLWEQSYVPPKFGRRRVDW